MQHWMVLWALGAVLLSCFTAEAGAEEDSVGAAHRLEEVVVTATRTERANLEVPAGVSVVGAQQLADARLIGVKEVLGGLPGVLAETRNNGYDARLLIRGAGLKARYGVREIMVLLDGVPITDPDGLTRFDFVDTQLVDQVEVVRGPNSTLYGANAAGGVVHVRTRSPFDEERRYKVGYGANHTQLGNLIFGTHRGDTYLTFSGTRKSSDGWRQWNHFESTQGGVKVGHLFAGGSSLELNVTYTDAELQLPGGLTDAEFDADPEQRTSEPFRHSRRDSEVFFASLRAETSVAAFDLTGLGYGQSWHHFHPVPGGINDARAFVYGADLQADQAHSVLGRRGQLTFGVSGQVDLQHGTKSTYRDVAVSSGGRLLATLSDAEGERMESAHSRITKWGLYAQESLALSDRWQVDLGARFDRVVFDRNTELRQVYDWATGSYRDERRSIDVAETFEHLSPRLAVVGRLHPVLSVYANLATGFQTPQDAELEDNPDLDPVLTRSYEAGLKFRGQGGHSLDLAWFYMQVADEIVQAQVASGEVSYSNAGETRKRGMEVAGQVQLGRSLTVGGSYTYSDFMYADFDEPVTQFDPVSSTSQTLMISRNGNHLPYIPRHQYSLFARCRHASGLKLSAATYTWGEYYVDSANSKKYKGYRFLTNVLVGFENRYVDLSVDVQNVFNARYAVEVTKDSRGALRYIPGAPRTWFGKVTLKF